jgi:hypothetical protein
LVGLPEFLSSQKGHGDCRELEGPELKVEAQEEDREREVNGKVIKGRERPDKIHCATWVFVQRVDIQVGGKSWAFEDMLCGLR